MYSNKHDLWEFTRIYTYPLNSLNDDLWNGPFLFRVMSNIIVQYCYFELERQKIMFVNQVRGRLLWPISLCEASGIGLSPVTALVTWLFDQQVKTGHTPSAMLCVTDLTRCELQYQIVLLHMWELQTCLTERQHVERDSVALWSHFVFIMSIHSPVFVPPVVLATNLLGSLDPDMLELTEDCS